ncbi:MAG: flagellar basal body-associated FliL family protein [Rhodospirillales bacterium]|nr:flagellar basal body-associated FliL family protein [Rhodospirillales bacterium]
MNADAPAKSEEEVDDQNEITAEEAPKGFKAKLLAKKKLIIFVVLGLVVLGGGGAGLYFSGLIKPNGAHEVEVVLPDPPVFQEIQRITVDMKPSPDHVRPFIRLSMQAELQGESAKLAFIANEAKIMDAIQSHLRDTTVEELEGEQGTERLRKDLTTIINRAITPEVAIGVLYKDILIR